MTLMPTKINNNPNNSTVISEKFIAKTVPIPITSPKINRISTSDKINLKIRLMKFCAYMTYYIGID
jgi:hypothetical protein